MALEQSIETLTAAVNGLAALIKGGAAVGATAATTGKPATAATAATKPAKGPKNNAEKVAQAAAKVKTEIGKDQAVFLIKTVGKAEKLAEIKPENYDAFVAACETSCETGEVEGFGEPADEDM